MSTLLLLIFLVPDAHAEKLRPVDVPVPQWEWAELVPGARVSVSVTSEGRTVTPAPCAEVESVTPDGMRLRVPRFDVSALSERPDDAVLGYAICGSEATVLARALPEDRRAVRFLSGADLGLGTEIQPGDPMLGIVGTLGAEKRAEMRFRDAVVADPVTLTLPVAESELYLHYLQQRDTAIAWCIGRREGVPEAFDHLASVAPEGMCWLPVMTTTADLATEVYRKGPGYADVFASGTPAGHPFAQGLYYVPPPHGGPSTAVVWLVTPSLAEMLLVSLASGPIRPAFRNPDDVAYVEDWTASTPAADLLDAPGDSPWQAQIAPGMRAVPVPPGSGLPVVDRGKTLTGQDWELVHVPTARARTLSVSAGEAAPR